MNSFNSYMNNPMGTAFPSYQNNFPTPSMGMQNAYAYPHYDIIKVNGEAGAKSFKMSPNSSVLLLDETAPIVWLVQTDGGGYSTASPFSITPYQPQQPVDLNSLEERISRLEKNYESYTGNAKQSKKRQQQQNQFDSPESATGATN